MDKKQNEEDCIDQQLQRAIDELNALHGDESSGGKKSGDKKAAVLAALERGDFAVEYRLPENVDVREQESVETPQALLGCGVSAFSGIVPDVVVGGICLHRKAKKNDKAQKNHRQCHRTATAAIAADNRANRWQ